MDVQVVQHSAVCRISDLVGKLQAVAERYGDLVVFKDLQGLGLGVPICLEEVKHGDDQTACWLDDHRSPVQHHFPERIIL